MSGVLAITVTRWWTRVYTLGLPADLREARRAEIESDLWESLHDPDAPSPQILPRLAGGLLGMALASGLAPRKAALNRIFASLVFVVAAYVLYRNAAVIGL